MLGGEVTSADKSALRDRLRALADQLDRLLAAEYGVDLKKATAYDAWRASHQPMHWFVEFYGIMSKGGFDVVVGNPPYVEYSKAKSEYTVKGYQTESCGNLYAMMWERSIELTSSGQLGLIVPVAAVCTDGYAPLRELLASGGSLVISNFSDRPSGLFGGVENSRLCIILLNKGGANGQCVHNHIYQVAICGTPIAISKAVLRSFLWIKIGWYVSETRARRLKHRYSRSSTKHLPLLDKRGEG